MITYHEGKLYAGNFIFDAKTGAVVAGAAGRAATRVTPPSQHLLLIAGGHTYGLDGARRAKGDSGPAQGTLSVYTLDGKKVAESLLTNAPAEGEKREQARSQNGRDAWAFSYGYPFTIGGDRLYIRSHDFLWCIGAK